MNLGLLSAEGALYLLRWMHYFFGVMWIGHLYYFNFVQGAFFNETDASTKSNAIQKLVPRALWWFRWGAMWTMVTGLLILQGRAHMGGMDQFFTGWGLCILTGSLFGLTMWFNVWFVIWPNQKIVIANAEATAKGGAANPAAAAAGSRALVASRTNVMLSIPMLFFMGAGRHLPIMMSETSSLSMYWYGCLAIWAVIEWNALKGKTGPMTSIKGVITSGFVLCAALVAWLEISL